MHRNHTATRRRVAALGLIIAMSVCGLVAACATATGDAPASEPLPVITDARTCAAAAVYARATQNDWSQRAAIANATLNQYRTASPDCGPVVARVLIDGFQPAQWQAALDAVDAVASGSYALPPACIRANRVVPPADALGPGLQCVIAGLAFVEAP